MSPPGDHMLTRECYFRLLSSNVSRVAVFRLLDYRLCVFLIVSMALGVTQESRFRVLRVQANRTLTKGRRILNLNKLKTRCALFDLETSRSSMLVLWGYLFQDPKKVLICGFARSTKRIVMLGFFFGWSVLAIGNDSHLEDAVLVGDGKNSEGRAHAPRRVLFVGNSYLYYNDSLHNHVRRILEELQPVEPKKLIFKSATIGGAQLSHHPIAWHLEHKNLGVAQPFEVVILQGGSAEVLNPKREQAFQETVDRFCRLIREAGGEPLLYMTHAYVTPHQNVEEGQIDRIESAYLRAGRRNGVRVIPVGRAFDQAYREFPDIRLHETFDGSHPNLNGTYLASLVVYLSLYGGDLKELNYDYFGELAPSVSKPLQRIAESVVLKFQSNSAINAK